MSRAGARQDYIQERPGMYTQGYVYFIREGRTGPIKIGAAGMGGHRRRNDLQCGNPRKLFHLGDVYAEDFRGLEEEFHALFDGDRIRGEWFRNTPELRAFIADLRPRVGRVL